MISLVQQLEYPECPENHSLLSMLMVLLTMVVCISDVLSFAKFCISTI